MSHATQLLDRLLRRPALAAAGVLALTAGGLVATTWGAAALAQEETPEVGMGEALEPEHVHWDFVGPFGTLDRAALQRGYQVYREVCSSCHSMKFMYFRNLGQEGGPFFDEEYPNPNDNPRIKALAAQFMVEDGPDDTGQMFERDGRPSDHFPNPFPNDQTARLANGGALPPDLSLIVKAREGGPDYVHAILTGFREAPRGVDVPPGMNYNPWFSGGQIRMAPPLPDNRVEYADGTEATNEQMAEDVVEFLTWVADPHTEGRKRLGLAVLAYLTILTVLLWLSYKRLWRDVKKH
jgi:ubiquinol-cytochrome c reductase cytochrome c1 subunit